MSDDLELRLLRNATAYARCIDDGRLEEWPGFFTEHCVYRVTTAENYARGYEAGVIWANSRAMLVDRVAALREANIFEPQTYRHLLGMPTVLDAQDDRVHSETPFFVARITGGLRTDLFATGRYVDVHVITPSELKVDERVVVCDSSAFDTLVALPL